MSSAQPRRGTVMVVGVLGLVLGAGIMALVWWISSASSGGPAADANAACAVVDRTDSLDPKTDMAGLRRWGGAAELAAAAAEGDAEYKSLADALVKPRELVMRHFDGEHPDVLQAVEDARKACQA